MTRECVPDSCKACTWAVDTKRSGGEFAKCTYPKNKGYYLSTLHAGGLNNFQGTRNPCPFSERIIKIVNTRLWIRMYRKGIEKEFIPLDAVGKEKALVRANWLVMKIAYTADWFIKRYDKKMEQRRLAYRIRQSINSYISIE